MSYRPKIDPKSRIAARLISRVQRAIQKALIESGKSQQEVATALGVDRSVINRRLRGGANLTARSIAEFAYVFDKDVRLEFLDKAPVERSNSTRTSRNIVDLQQFRGTSTSGASAPVGEFSLESNAS